MIELAPASSAAAYATARRLITGYARALEIDLAYQHFDAELANLETVYGPPDGFLLLAM